MLLGTQILSRTNLIGHSEAVSRPEDTDVDVARPRHVPACVFRGSSGRIESLGVQAVVPELIDHRFHAGTFGLQIPLS